MEQIKSTIKTIEKRQHLFYCDECGKYLGASTEYDDGYYQTYGDFRLKFCVVDNWYRVTKCFCDDCREKFINNVKTNLTNMGFEKD